MRARSIQTSNPGGPDDRTLHELQTPDKPRASHNDRGDSCVGLVHLVHCRLASGVLSSVLGRRVMTYPVQATSSPEKAPFAPGDIVIIRGFENLGLQRVDACEWATPPGQATACWTCECSDALPWPEGSANAREHALHGDAGGSWRGPASFLSRHAGTA
jgi:hypothetical protein